MVVAVVVVVVMTGSDYEHGKCTSHCDAALDTVSIGKLKQM